MTLNVVIFSMAAERQPSWRIRQKGIALCEKKNERYGD